MVCSACNVQVFNSPEDKIIYDVGHQAYVHKILTNRRSRMSTIRQTGGLSGSNSCSKPADAVTSQCSRSCCCCCCCCC